MMASPTNRPKKAIDVIHEGRGLLDEEYPGLSDALDKLDDDKISTEDFARQALNSLKDRPEFLEGFNELDERLQKTLRDFMEGKSAKEVTRGGFKTPLSPVTARHFKELKLSEVEGDEARHILKGSEDSMKVYVNHLFKNWGDTVQNTPEYTYVPTLVSDVQNIIKRAIETNRRVRAAGFRHSWSNVYSENKEVLVSLLDLSVATGGSQTVHEVAEQGTTTDFNKIELYGEDVPGTGGQKRWARIGAGVTNEQFRIWSIKNLWTLPLNVIMVEITFGGANAPVCHGAGITHKTLSDLVREIEYVDAKGVIRTVSDPEELKAAAGAFGLLGIVTNITLELDKMTYANLSPAKQDVKTAIPAPRDYTLPEGFGASLTPDQYKKAESDFISKANQYYAEWFWFAYQKKVWINCWDNTTDASGAVDNPSQTATFLQWASSLFAAWLNAGEAFKKKPGRTQGSINGTSAMALMPPRFLDSGKVKTYLIDGLHFRRGIQNFPVRDMELQIPIPALETDSTKPDWSVVQRAWWDAITLVYDDMYKTGAMRLVLEMRIMSSSDVIMAPQTGNNFGTASIEVLSNLAAGEDGSWPPFLQKIVDKWTAYKANGATLNVRPHWAKEWEGYTVDKVEWKTHMKEVCYKEEIPKFKEVLAGIGKKQNWTLDDLKARFSNNLFDDLIFSA